MGSLVEIIQALGPIWERYAREIFRNLFRTIAQHKTISYYLVEEQKPDEVLDIFIRANSGGTPLSKSDLLMSMATHLWTNVDIRKEMVEVIDSVAEFGRGEKFRINRDFVLKTCLVLHSEDVKSLLVNFNPDNIHRFEENWVETRKCIECAFEYLDKCGFDDRTLQAKGPVISLIYYIYSNNLQDSINKDIFDKDGTNRKNIITWLIRVFVNGIYGGAPDSTHIKFRKILRENPGKFFPYDAILEAYSKEGNGLHVSEEVLRNRLETSKFGSDKAGYLLILIYSDLANKSHTHIDHLHPKSVFKSGDYKKVIPGEDWEFVEKTWNTVLNLQLLEETLNESKNDMPLSDWLKVSGKDKSLLFIDEDTSTDLKDYRKFIENREKKLLYKLKTILNLSDGEEDTIDN